MSLPSLLANASLADAPWSAANWTLNNEFNDSSDALNASAPLPYSQTPAELRQYLLIFRLVLLGIGVLDTFLLLLVYVKCSNIIISSLGVYVANLSIAALVDMLDVAIWALKEFGYQLEDLVSPLPSWVYSMQQLPQFGLPTTSLFLTLLIIDRFFATIFAGCHKGCYGFKPNAVFLTLVFWAGSFFLTFVLVYRNLLFPHDELFEQLRFLISYIGPLGLKFLLLIVLFAKRKVVPDNDVSQAMINRQRESLYYALTIIFLHILFSLPYYAVQVNRWYPLVEFRIDDWMILAAYSLSEVPIVLNPIFCLSIDPEFRESLVYLCTCSGRSRRDMTDLCDDHAESQPLAPMATSPMAEEKEHLDEAES